MQSLKQKDNSNMTKHLIYISLIPAIVMNINILISSQPSNILVKIQSISQPIINNLVLHAQFS